jgi:hypothetical protein
MDPSFIISLRTDSRLRIGALFYALMIDRQWKNRQVEALRVSEERRYRRQISFDIEIPDDVLRAADGISLRNLPVPLVFLEKSVLMALDTADAAKASIPVLTRPQNGALSEAALEWAIRNVVGDKYRQETSTLVSALIMSKVSSTETLKNEIRELRQDLDETEVNIQQLWWVVETLDNRFIFTVDIPLTDSMRRLVLKISYETDELIKRPEIVEGRWKKVFRVLGEQLGILTYIFDISTTQAGASASYHFEIDAPAGLDLTQITVVPTDLPAGSFQETRRFSSMGHAVIELPEAVGTEGKHLDGIKIRAELTPTLDGLVLSSLTYGAVTAIVLTLGLLNYHRFLHQTSDPAVALLLLAPGLISTFIVRPGEHEFSSRLLRNVRVLAVIPGLLSFCAAAILVSHIDPPTVVLIGQILVGICWTAVILSGNIARKAFMIRSRTP